MGFIKKYKMKFVITVDTEADNQWVIPSKLSLNNLKYIERFHYLCKHYGFPVTYLLTHEVASSYRAKKLFAPWLQKAECEVGAHLHPWSYSINEDSLVHAHPLPSDYSYEKLKEMICSLTDLIESNFNIKPVSYRAGRYGICLNQIQLLKELGYKIDSSITPNIVWNVGGKNGKIDYSNYNNYSYEININNINTEGNSGIYEIPITTFKLQNVKNKIKKLVGKNEKYILFRMDPSISVKYLINYFKKVYSQKTTDYIMLFLHSSELMPGGSPYFKSQDNIESMYCMYEKLFKYIKRYDIEGVILKNVLST